MLLRCKQVQCPAVKSDHGYKHSHLPIAIRLEMRMVFSAHSVCGLSGEGGDK